MSFLYGGVKVNYYNEIKNILISNEAYKKVKDYYKNRNDLMSYYNVGKLLIDAQGGEARAKYGNHLIKEYSIKLTKELGKGYTVSVLKRMRQFYLFQKGAPLGHQLSWSHYRILLPLKDKNKINYYINKCIEYNLSKRKLEDIIKSKEYERLSDETKNKLISNKEVNIKDNILNPIIINTFNKDITKFNEKLLKEFILNDISRFMEQLGNGYSFIKDEYPILLGDRYNYIDLLLYNIKFKCYVVIELKATELKSEYIGQIKKYMNYIDKNIKSFDEDDTIGIIICKKDNKFVMEYCSDDRVFRTTYILN